MRNKELLLGTILSYAQQIVGVLLGLLYTPFLLSRLGQSEYGLYSTVSAAIAMISLISLGLGNGYIKYYSLYDKANNQDGKNKLNGMFMSIFTVLGAIALIIGVVVSNHLSWIFKNGLTGEEYVIAKRLSLILSLNIAVSFPATVFNAIITAHERFVVQKLIGMLRTVLAPAVTIPLLLFGFKSIALVSVSFTISIIADIGLALYVLIGLKEKFVFNNFEKGLLNGLLIYIWPIALNMLIDQINLNIDKLLLGRYKGTADVAVYNIGYTLYAMYMTISTSVSSVFTPRVHAIVTRNNDNKAMLRTELSSLFTRVGRIQCELLLLVITGFIFFGMPFITVFWTDAGYTNSYYVFLLLAIPATIPLVQNLGIEIQRAENLHQFRSIVYGIMAIMNLALSIYLCQKYGAVGSAIGTAISFAICNGIIINIYYQKKCSIDIISFWKSILRILISITPAIVIWLLIRQFFDLTSLPVFVLGIAVYSIVYSISLWLLGMNSEEKNLVRGIMLSLKTKLIGK